MVLRILKLFLLSCSLFAATFADATSSSEAFKGFYVGADVGFLGASSATSFTPDTNYLDSGDIAQLNTVTAGAVHPNALIGGLQGGYNYRIAQYLFGMTVDWGLMNLNNTRNIVTPVASRASLYNFYITQKIQSNWMITVHPRIGFVAKEKLLMYLTGGLAFANFSNTNTYADNLVESGYGPSKAYASAQMTTIKTGWLVGAGEEYLLNKHLSVQFEYLYINFSDLVSSSALSLDPNYNSDHSFYGNFQYHTNPQFNIVHLGINYYF